MHQISVDLTEREVLLLIAEYVGKKYNTKFVTGSLRPCYDTSGFVGYSSNAITGYNFTGKTKG